MTTATSISVSANIPVEPGEILDKVARAEESTPFEKVFSNVKFPRYQTPAW